MLLSEWPLEVNGRRYTVQVVSENDKIETTVYDDEGDPELALPGQHAEELLQAVLRYGLGEFEHGTKVAKGQLQSELRKLLDVPSSDYVEAITTRRG